MLVRPHPNAAAEDTEGHGPKGGGNRRVRMGAPSAPQSQGKWYVLDMTGAIFALCTKYEKKKPPPQKGGKKKRREKTEAPFERITQNVILGRMCAKSSQVQIGETLEQGKKERRNESEAGRDLISGTRTDNVRCWWAGRRLSNRK